MNQIKPVWLFAKNHFKRLDKLLLLLCIIASAFSVYLLYTMAQNEINPNVISSRTWKMQLLTSGVGVCVALVMSMIDYKILSKIVMFGYMPIAIVLSLLLFTSLGMSTPGSEELNWLSLGPIQIQPSEFVTVGLIMTLATHIYKVGDRLNHVSSVLLLCIHAFVPIGIMVRQHNTGAPMLVLLIFIMMLFFSGISWRYIVAAAVVAPGAAFAIWNFYAKDYHKLRIQVIFNEAIRNEELLGFFYQQHQSLRAMSSGGLTGQGLSGGEYISIFAMHNDFIYAYIGMTLGLVGCVVVLLPILFICIKLLAIMTTAKDALGRAICAGTFATIFFHTVINVGMVTALTPVVGVPLPLISSGGSATLSLYIAVGMVLSVKSHREKKYHMFYTEKD